MAVSEKQLAANRANAMKSTGPKDTSKTKFNGIKHGLTARHSLLPWEHKDDLDAVIEAFESHYQPTAACERLLVKDAAEAYWRKERAKRQETSLFEVLVNTEVGDSGHKQEELHAGHLEMIGFLKAAEHMDRFRRYDAHLQRSFEKALARVEQMASLRKPGAEPLPPAEPAEEPSRKGLKKAMVHLPLKIEPLRVFGEILEEVEEVSDSFSSNAHAINDMENKGADAAPAAAPPPDEVLAAV